MSVSDEQLYAYLQDVSLISRTSLVAAREYARTHDVSLVEVLVQQGYLSADEVRRVVAQCLGIPFITLNVPDIAPEALILLPEPFCRAHSMVAYAYGEEGLEVAVLETEGLLVLEEYASEHIYKIIPRMTDAASMTRALIQYQKILKEKHGKTIQYAVRDGLSEPLVDGILGHALASSASEAHFEPRDRGVLVRYRVQGQLFDAMTVPTRAYPGLLARFKQVAKLLPDSASPQTGRFTVQQSSSALDSVSCQVATLPTRMGERVLLSIAPHNVGRRGMALESLGFHGAQIDDIQRVLARPAGMVVVGSDAPIHRSALLYTLLDVVARPQRTVVAIESATYIPFPGVNQVQLSPQLGQTYASAVRAALTNLPDVLLVDLVQDAQTAELLVHAANRGVLVLVGTTAPNALEVLLAVAGYGISPALLAATLRLVIGSSTVSVPTTAEATRQLSHSEARLLEPIADFGRVLGALRTEDIISMQTLWKDVAFIDAEPNHIQRIGVHEVVPMTRVLQMQLEQEAGLRYLLEAMRSSGALTLVEEALYQAAQGRTTVSEVLRVAQEYTSIVEYNGEKTSHYR